MIRRRLLHGHYTHLIDSLQLSGYIFILLDGVTVSLALTIGLKCCGWFTLFSAYISSIEGVVGCNESSFHPSTAFQAWFCILVLFFSH